MIILTHLVLACTTLFYPHERVQILTGSLARVSGHVMRQLPNCKYEVEVVVNVGGIPMFSKTVQAGKNLKVVE